MAAYHENMAITRYFGAGTIFVEDPDDFGSIFVWYLVYAKASWVVHMLRHVLGEEDFFAALAAYRAVHEGGTATTEQFRDVCEAVSGVDLDRFFAQWIYGEYYPRYRYSWYSLADDRSTRVRLQIEQTQTDTGLFAMPLDVTVTTDTGVYEFVVQNDQAIQDYTFTVGGTVLGLELDRDGWVLKTVEEVAVDVPPADLARARLLPNRPNPFNPVTTIPFVLPSGGGLARLQVFDATGKLVQTLCAGFLSAGPHTAVWNGLDQAGRPVASGTYFYRLRAPGCDLTRKMTLLK